MTSVAPPRLSHSRQVDKSRQIHYRIDTVEFDERWGFFQIYVFIKCGCISLSIFRASCSAPDGLKCGDRDKAGPVASPSPVRYVGNKGTSFCILHNLTVGLIGATRSLVHAYNPVFLKSYTMHLACWPKSGHSGTHESLIKDAELFHT